LGAIRNIIIEAFTVVSPVFEDLYAKSGRPSNPAGETRALLRKRPSRHSPDRVECRKSYYVAGFVADPRQCNATPHVGKHHPPAIDAPTTQRLLRPHPANTPRSQRNTTPDTPAALPCY
jgi:hypothetical protein